MKSRPNITTLSAFRCIPLIITIKYFNANRFKGFNIDRLPFLFVGIITNSACEILYFNKFLVFLKKIACYFFNIYNNLNWLQTGQNTS
jgi:undecaprenyl pyrophosphate phosphatase UppP